MFETLWNHQPVYHNLPLPILWLLYFQTNPRNRLGGDTRWPQHTPPRDTTGNDDDEIENTNLS